MTDPLAPAPPPAPAPTAGPSSTTGLVYADVPNRAIAYILDSILVFFLVLIVGIVFASIGLATSKVTGALVTETNYVATIIVGLIGIAISGAYFVYTWTRLRATLGMRALGMQIGNAGDGKTLTTDQAIRRFAAVAAPSVIAQVFQPVPGLGLLLSLVALGWVIYLLYTTANSPTKQGWHDKFANTQVVKAAKSV